VNPRNGMRGTGTREWKVLDVREGKVEPNPHGGNFQKFYVDFEGSDDTYWRRKEGDKPEVGKSYYGTITEGNYGPMFKKEKKPEGGGFEARPGGRGGDWQPESERDPERAARILRQHSQEMALRWTALLQAADPNLAQTNGGLTLAQAFQFADAFDRDVNEAGQAASQGAGASAPLDAQASSPATTPAPEKPPADTAQWFTKLLEDAHMDPVAALELGKYIAHKFSDEQRKRAASGLRDLDAQGETVKRLTSAYEKSEGKLLPLSSDDDGEGVPL
jgi:hypothetical protein